MSFETRKFKLDVGTPIISEQIEGGNSFVFKGHLPNGMTIAVKEYVGDKIRIERMISREVDSIKFLRNFGIENIPEILEVQYELGLIIYRWIDGREASPDSRSMDELLKFCITLKEIYKSAEIFQNSVDSVFSFRELESQISNRIQELSYAFPYSEVTELCHRLKVRLENCNKYRKNYFFTNKTFSVSDLGTHNMIASRGIYYFIDFEFFGLDSIAKMVGDFILHPRNMFSQKNVLRFVSTITEKFDWDSDDLMEILPLLTLKWSLISYLRTLKEHRHKGINKLEFAVIDKSLGTQYLRYFDQSGHVGSNNLIKTFSSFRGIIDQ